MTNLNSLVDPASGLNLFYASAISNSGYITGYGYDGNSQKHAFLLTPTAPVVPETSLMITLGLLLVLGSLIFAVQRKIRWV